MGGDVRRVLMTADAVGGVWSYALDLCRALSRDGIRITLAVMGPPPSDAQRAGADQIPGLDLLHQPFRLEWMDSPWEDVAAAGDWLCALEQTLAPDIVHLNGFALAARRFAAPVLVVGHSCLCSWAAAIPGKIEAGKLSAYHAQVSRGLQAADMVVAPSGAMLRALVDHYGPLHQAAVIYNGREASMFRPAAKEPLIVTAGRLWDRAKNVAAVAAVADTLEWPVFVAGDGAADASWSTHLHALGRLTEAALAEWLGRASIFVLPARYEPFGLLPLEAALSGCALVLGDIPSLREIWGPAADYVTPDDHDALRRRIRETMHPERCRQRAADARVRARAYPASRMTDSYRALYQTMIATPRRSRPTACAS